jgi:hypothetical protein
MRKEVEWFAHEMEDVLKSKDHLHPLSWKLDEMWRLSFAMDTKVADVLDFINFPEGYTKEEKIRLCVDVANYAMMIADRVENGEV